jgi:hypothetical protein
MEKAMLTLAGAKKWRAKNEKVRKALEAEVVREAEWRILEEVLRLLFAYRPQPEDIHNAVNTAKETGALTGGEGVLTFTYRMGVRKTQEGLAELILAQFRGLPE